MDVSSPPQYRRISRSAPESQTGVELPPYSRRDRRATLAQPITRREPTEHIYQLLDGRGKPWASLKVLSSAKSAKSLPTFFEKENVNGSLDLHVERSDSIQSITATITGTIITGARASDEITFLNHSVPIWSKHSDQPRLPSPSEGASGSKLSGHCHWPFSIPLPRTVDVPSRNGLQEFRLPETFLERHTSASIQYDLTIRISRGKLKSDSRIKTAFGYVPNSRPEPASFLRQVAYEQNMPLPGPDADPEGWHQMTAVSVKGVVFKTRKAEVNCHFSLAKPLCYTRGSVLPCSLILESSDIQALDMLSLPTSIVVVLQRCVRTPKSETVENIGTAVWWPVGAGRTSSSGRHLEGEIRLSKDLRPSCNLGPFSISYHVALCPFDAVSFAAPSSSPLLVQPVEIATMYARGPKPLAYSPPLYERGQDENYYPPYATGQAWKP